MSGDLEYTDVWNFPSVRPYRGKHPAEKPLSMLTHIINASSYEGDIVLDCFAGSGATGVAAIQTNRKAVLIDIEEQWAKRSSQRIRDAVFAASENSIISLADRKTKNKKAVNQTLFD
jgi:site-specific DNA-methyltransferase (adenine-specific)